LITATPTVNTTDSLRLGVLIACHNRRDKTLACLSDLERETAACPALEASVFLVDDASSDGTGEAVRRQFPAVKVIYGDGTLYWGGGMRLAFNAAQAHDFDLYLWLNDDVRLLPGALACALRWRGRLALSNRERAVLVGRVLDPLTGAENYGVLRRASALRPLRFVPVPASDGLANGDTFSGNFVLIPRGVAAVLGNIDRAFTQDLGDYDYGLRAGRNGLAVLAIPEPIGTCAKAPLTGGWLDPTLPLGHRLAMLRHPKGMPVAEWSIFARRHGGRLGLLHAYSPYLSVLVRPLLSSWWAGLQRVIGALGGSR
jgi:GT2 family glycosyltransferase